MVNRLLCNFGHTKDPDREKRSKSNRIQQYRSNYVGNLNHKKARTRKNNPDPTGLTGLPVSNFSRKNTKFRHFSRIEQNPRWFVRNQSRGHIGWVEAAQKPRQLRATAVPGRRGEKSYLVRCTFEGRTAPTSSRQYFVLQVHSTNKPTEICPTLRIFVYR